MKFILYIFLLVISITLSFAQKRINTFYQNPEISLFTDDCINSNTQNKICFKIRNYNDVDINIETTGLTYYSILFDSKGNSPKRKSIIEFEKNGSEYINIKANDSTIYCETTPFFRQFELNCNELYYYLPIYYNSIRKKANGVRPLQGPITIKPLVFKICDCKD